MLHRFLSSTSKRFLAGVVAFIASSACVRASDASAASEASDPYDLPPHVDAALQSALDANYALQFDRADAILRTLEAYRDTHLMIEFGFVLTEWWRLTAAVLEEDEEASRLLLASIDDCVAKAEARLALGDPTGEAHLVKGAVLGLLGRWHITNHHWRRSYVIGRKAKSALQQAVQINPDLFDAYSGIGIYDYFVARLPGIVRFFAFRGAEKDPEAGLRQIDLALTHGRFTVTGTKAALVLIQLRIERDPARALELADELVAEYPDSAFFRSLRMIALHDLGRSDDLAAEAGIQAGMLADGRFPSTRAAQVHFAQGLAHFVAGEREAAGADFDAAIARTDPTDPWSTWARLHLGYLRDLAGDRTGARRYYREVKRLTNRMGTARLAERYLDIPYRFVADAPSRLLPD